MQARGDLAVVERTIVMTEREVKSASPSSPIPEPLEATYVSYRAPSRMAVEDQRYRTIRFDDEEDANGGSLPELQEEEAKEEIKGDKHPTTSGKSK